MYPIPVVVCARLNGDPASSGLDQRPSPLDRRAALPHSKKPCNESHKEIQIYLLVDKARSPFPLALNDSRSVRAVKGSLRRFAPWTACGPIRKTRCLRGKRGVVGSGRVDAPKGTFRPYQLSEPQPRGAVTRRAVAQRRSRASGLTRPLAEAIRGVWVGFCCRFACPFRCGLQ